MKVGSRNISFSLTAIILFFKVFPIKPIFGMPIAPENLFYYFAMILVILNFKRNPPADRTIINIIILYSVFHVIVFANMYMFSSDVSYPLFSFFKSTLFFLVVLNINDKKDYIYLLKLYFILLISETLLSILALYAGGLFQKIFDLFAMNPEENQSLYLTGRLSGFTGKVFLYAYPLSALPVLALTFYKLSGKIHYIYLLLLALFALILNGERAALIFSMIISFYLMIRWFSKKQWMIILILLSISAFFVFNEILIKPEVEHGFMRIRDSSSDELQWRLAKQAAMAIVVIRHPIEGGLINKGEYEMLFHSWSGFFPTQPHNAYINMGMYAGIFGWVILVLFIRCIRILKRRVNQIKNESKSFIIFVEGNFWALMAVMSVSLFHNAGLFDGERSSVALIGLLFIAIKNKRKKSQKSDKKISYEGSPLMGSLGASRLE